MVLQKHHALQVLVVLLALILLGLGPLEPQAALTATLLASSFDRARALAAARGGDVIVIPPGTYAGNLVVDKSVTLVGAACSHQGT